MSTASPQNTSAPSNDEPAADPIDGQAAELLINWELAEVTASKLAAPGPSLTRKEAAAEVQGLREAADAAIGHVHRLSGIAVAEELGRHSSGTLVVDRKGWAQSNAASFRKLLAPALNAAVKNKPDMVKEGSSAQVFGSAAAGVELGGVLAFLSSKVLGQFEPFHQDRLMLVAPNIVEVQRELNVNPEDFRLWVCLHEQTHRVQFAAAPWLAEHMNEQIAELSASTVGNSESLAERFADAFKQMKNEAASGDEDTSVPKNKLLHMIQSPEDRARMSHLTAVMSVLEGHANVIMDAVDSSVVPSIKTIRRRFEARGKSHSPIERMIRKILQLDVKAAQYRDGQKFVGHIVEAVGMEKFNTIWEAVEHFPTEEELHDPDAWIDRMGFGPVG